jgi:hypothetical protein
MMTKPDYAGLINLLREEELRLSRGAWDHVECGIASNLASAAADRLEALREESEAAAYYIDRLNAVARGVRVRDLEEAQSRYQHACAGVKIGVSS